MKKKLLNLCLFMLPFVAFGQKDSLFVKDIDGTGFGILTTISVNDDVKVMQIMKSEDKFDLLAVNNKMQILWKTTLKGFALTSAKFKNKIVAVASTDYSKLKGPNNTYTGYLIDPATGKVLIEKEVFNDQKDFRDRATFIISEKGDFFKMAVQETAMSTSIFAGTKNERVTKALTFFDFNDRLESTLIKPDVISGTFTGVTGNENGDMFTSWVKPNNTFQVVKYPAGKTDVKGIVGKEIDMALSETVDGAEYKVSMFPSLSTPNNVYFILLLNVKRKEKQLSIIKYDFTTGQYKFIQEEFTNDALKQLDKSTIFDASNKNDKPDFGYVDNFEVRFAKEQGGNIAVAFSGITLEKGSMGIWVVEGALLINVYDKDLNLKSQVGLPSGYAGAGMGFPRGFRMTDKYLYTLANEEIGGHSTTVFGKLNMVTGQWEKMDWLKKDGIGKTHASDGSSALQFPNCMILPYQEPSGIQTGPMLKVSLDLYKYPYADSE